MRSQLNRKQFYPDTTVPNACYFMHRAVEEGDDSMAKGLTVAFTVLAGLAGLVTAFYWWKSSRVDVDPKMETHPQLHYSVDGDYSKTVEALRTVGYLNKVAASWSALTSIFATMAGLSSLF